MKRAANILLGTLWAVLPSGPGADAAGVSSVLLDDEVAEFTGEWVTSSRVPALVGKTYRHDNNRDQGRKSARFSVEVPATGEYEVRLLYAGNHNRATMAAVTVISEEGERKLSVNQREDAIVDGLPRALGVFKFAAGRKGAVVVSNEGADGFVVVDGVELMPAGEARAEREAGVRRYPAGAAGADDARKNPVDEKAASAARAEPVRLATAAKAGDVDGKCFDVVVVGGTPAGVACAVRAAREGAGVLLVNHTDHLGGMMANGLMQWDALYGGHRAPLFSEILRDIERYYRTVYGENSRDYERVRFTQEHYPMGWAEPHVAEREFNRLVAGEKGVTLLLGHCPTRVAREGSLVRHVFLSATPGAQTGMSAPREIRVSGSIFVDATYEGDLFALAKVPYRVGREAREEFSEPHAGVVFCNIDKGPAPREAVEGRLNIHPYGSKQGAIDPTSPFTPDGAVQAYNYRFCVTKDPANRIMLAEPPPGYDREEYINYERKGIATNAGPNLKSHMNSPILPGENHGYPEGTWAERERITRRHRNFGLGLIWFLQNDESVPPKKREAFRAWGLPRDEFADNNHVPYEMYVREARRITGRHVYSEHDNSLAAGLGRTPVHRDSVAITDWYMDSHSCTTNSRPGYHYDGKLILTEESRPGQIPYRSLLPKEVDNLLVPVCLSATHVAWGAVRLEPVWMETGEAAGFAAGLALKAGVPPAQLDPERLVRALVDARFMISFFNDANAGGSEPWVAAAQYFGTRGFFHDYNARPGDGLKAATARVWVDGFKRLRDAGFDPNAMARSVAEAEGAEGPCATGAEFAALMGGTLPATASAEGGALTRGAAMEMLWAMIKKGPETGGGL